MNSNHVGSMSLPDICSDPSYAVRGSLKSCHTFKSHSAQSVLWYANVLPIAASMQHIYNIRFSTSSSSKCGNSVSKYNNSSR